MKKLIDLLKMFESIDSANQYIVVKNVFVNI